jgi:hypothetical protein
MESEASGQDGIWSLVLGKANQDKHLGEAKKGF